MDPRAFSLRELTSLARGRERVEWHRWLPLVCWMSDRTLAEVLPAWLRDAEVAAPEPTEGDTRRAFMMWGKALGIGDPPEGW